MLNRIKTRYPNEILYLVINRLVIKLTGELINLEFGIKDDLSHKYYKICINNLTCYTKKT